MKRLRILLADHRSEIRSALRIILEPAYHVVGEADNGQAAVAGVRTSRPDLALVDIDLPVASGVETIRELHNICPDCRLIVYGSYLEPDVMAAAFDAGVSGYVIKGSDRDLLSTIQPVIKQLWNENQESGRNADDWAASWVPGNGQVERRVQRTA
ncbi:MAG TPA: response regulator transcription factor [Nitrospira sp.]|nr:response regulator transcription factor [Nitrospira sp.]